MVKLTNNNDGMTNETNLSIWLIHRVITPLQALCLN